MQVSQSPSKRGWRPFGALAGVTATGLGRDLAAGLTLAAIALPEQMATARLGGFPPQLGLMAFVAASLGFAAFGASRRLSAGADSTITPIFAGTLGAAAAAGSPQYAALAAVLALLVGLMLIAAGRLKLGWIADFLSLPVISGFLAGIAVHIVLSQAPSVLGVAEVRGDTLQKLKGLWAQRALINPAAVGMGLGTLAVIIAAEKITPRIPGALIAMAGATLATIALDLDRKGLHVLGPLPRDLPQLRWPDATLASGLPLLILAVVITLVVMVQTAATTRAFNDGDPDVDGDFVGVGVGSVLAAFVGAFPTNASPPRTGVVAASGGRSQWAGLAAALLVLLFALFGGALVARAPSAALAGVLLYVAQRIVRLRTFAELLRRTRAEFALALVTTALIVALPIETGVGIGIVLSLAHGVFTATRARPIAFEQVADTTVWWPVEHARPRPDAAGVLVMGFQAPLSFLNAYDFRRGVLDAINAADGRLRLFVLEASSIVEIDFTAATVLSEVIEAAHKAGVAFAVARLESVRAQTAFDRLGLTAALGEGRVFRTVAEAVAALSAASAAPPGEPLRRTT